MAMVRKVYEISQKCNLNTILNFSSLLIPSVEIHHAYNFFCHLQIFHIVSLPNLDSTKKSTLRCIEEKFKRALKLHFGPVVRNFFCHFSTFKPRNYPHMINHEHKFGVRFLKFLWDKLNSKYFNLDCIYTF